MPKFLCQICKSDFFIDDNIIAKFPGWVPKYCRTHSKTPVKSAPKPGKSLTATRDLTPEEVLDRFSEGPNTGLFTDGGSRPNPGPGGWGAVWVKDGKILKELHGEDPQTTNNRMELTALIEGISILPVDQEVEVFTDSELCVNIINKWMAGWKKNNWRKKSGEIANLDLIKRLDLVIEQHPKVHVMWIKAHNGWLWNEYVDSLATTCFR